MSNKLFPAVFWGKTVCLERGDVFWCLEATAGFSPRAVSLFKKKPQNYVVCLKECKIDVIEKSPVFQSTAFIIYLLI